MRIAILLLEDFPGCDNRVQRQTRSLLAAGHEVTVFAATGPSCQSEFEGATIVRSRVKRIKAGSLGRRLFDYAAFPLDARRWLAENGNHFDVVQATNPPDWMVWAALEWRKRSDTRRLVLDIHDPMPELMAAKHGDGPAVLALRALQRWSCRKADVVLVTTEPMRDLVGDTHGVSAVLIPNVVDPTNFVRRAPDPQPLQQRPVRVVYHGTVADRFGVDVAVDAVTALREEGFPAELDVYGDGDAMAEVRQRARAHDGAVRLHGQVPASALSGLLEGAAVGLVPYKDSSFMRLVESTKAYEYASLGIPVLGSDLPPLRAQLGDGGALYFTPGDAASLARTIKDAAENPDSTLEIARTAQQAVETSQWSHWQDSYLDVVTPRRTA